VYLTLPLNTLITDARSKKTRIMGYRAEKEVLTIFSALWIQYTNVTNRRTDGRTPDDSKDRTYAYH